jgi:phenylalanyl-tRNA synthetase alpha chain
MVDAVLGSTPLRGCDIVEIPDIVSVENNFDLLNTPSDHPSRSPGDTFYVDETHVLRTHNTAFWSYYLRDPAVRNRLETGNITCAVSYGKVYRNDEIDRNHFSVFHQIDGLCLGKKSTRCIELQDLNDVAVAIARALYGENVVWRISPDAFPFTTPSMQLEVSWRNEWLELMGGGLVHPAVLRRLGLNPAIYNGWAFGFGIDRLAMVKMEIPDIRILWLDDERVTRQFTGPDAVYHEVSKYPATIRDISMIIDRAVNMNRIYEIMRECGHAAGEDLIEEVKLIDQYAHAKFGAGKVGYTFRLVYRSAVRTLIAEEINRVQEEVRTAVLSELGAILR